jgi:hypothetical protein
MDLFSTLLRSAPQLLGVEWDFAKLHEPAEPLEIYHSRLRSLSISMKKPPVSALDRLSLPSLRTLSIKILRGWYFTWPLFKTFMLLNSGALESFALTSVVFKTADIIPCLQALPSLSHLNLSVLKSSTMTEPPIQDLLQALYCPKGLSSAVLPRLKVITISCVILENRQATVTKFVAMIESRWQLDRSAQSVAVMCSGVSRIQSASLTLRGSSVLTIPTEDSERLERLKSEGLEVQIITGLDMY